MVDNKAKAHHTQAMNTVTRTHQHIYEHASTAAATAAKSRQSTDLPWRRAIGNEDTANIETTSTRSNNTAVAATVDLDAQSRDENMRHNGHLLQRRGKTQRQPLNKHHAQPPPSSPPTPTPSRSFTRSHTRPPQYPHLLQHCGNSDERRTTRVRAAGQASGSSSLAPLAGALRRRNQFDRGVVACGEQPPPTHARTQHTDPRRAARACTMRAADHIATPQLAREERTSTPARTTTPATRLTACSRGAHGTQHQPPTPATPPLTRRARNRNRARPPARTTNTCTTTASPHYKITRTVPGTYDEQRARWSRHGRHVGTPSHDGPLTRRVRG
ncbi:hypothetical protein BD410DRAFT_808809 [Rickenella mellea]|uniref:Uncharacterized protein n=1 Tax=Rickenella mellea TaxID=50990 RepID=A0A4Y7PKR4_9AGAM|nr:hypothetical protein BD410DRAFT_808809 [Rickenella mellea]